MSQEQWDAYINDPNSDLTWAPVPAGTVIGVLGYVAGDSEYSSRNRPLIGHQVKLGADGNFELVNDCLYCEQFAADMIRRAPALIQSMEIMVAVDTFLIGGLSSIGAVGTTTLGLNTAAAGATSTAAGVATSAFGRSIQNLQESLRAGNGVWRRVSAHAEQALGRAYRGGTSIEEVFVNKQTGERIVRHIIVKGDRVVHETFRAYGKFGR